MAFLCTVHERGSPQLNLFGRSNSIFSFSRCRRFGLFAEETSLYSEGGINSGIRLTLTVVTSFPEEFPEPSSGIISPSLAPRSVVVPSYTICTLLLGFSLDEIVVDSSGFFPGFSQLFPPESHRR